MEPTEYGWTDMRYFYDVFYGEMTNGFEFFRWMWYQLVVFGLIVGFLGLVVLPLLLLNRKIRELFLPSSRYEVRGTYVLVTGAASGIGRATTERLANAGAVVFAADVQGETLTKLFGDRENVHVVQMDVTDLKSVSAAGEQVRKVTKRLHGLVNNAGIMVAPSAWRESASPIRGVAEASMDEILPLFDVNTFGMMRVVQEFYPLIREGPIPGCIVNLASVAGISATPWLAGYSASKFAVIGYTDALRRETKHAGVRVACLEPGVTRTPMLDVIKLEKAPSANSETKMAQEATRVRKRWAFWTGSSFMQQEPDNVAVEIVDVLFHRTPPAHSIVDVWHRKFIWWMGPKLPSAVQDFMLTFIM